MQIRVGGMSGIYANGDICFSEFYLKKMSQLSRSHLAWGKWQQANGEVQQLFIRKFGEIYGEIGKLGVNFKGWLKQDPVIKCKIPMKLNANANMWNPIFPLEC